MFSWISFSLLSEQKEADYLFWEVPALPCACMESLRQGAEQDLFKWNLLKPEPSLHNKLSKYCLKLCYCLLCLLTNCPTEKSFVATLQIKSLFYPPCVSSSSLQPALWIWIWRKFYLRHMKSHLPTPAPPLTPPCLPPCLLHCLPVFLITLRQTSLACRVSVVTTPTPFLPWPHRALGLTPPRCQSCNASVSSSKRNWERDSSVRWEKTDGWFVFCVWVCGWLCLKKYLFLLQKVHLCEIESPQDLPNLEFPFNVRKGRPLLVAVKILRPDASKNARCVRVRPAESGLLDYSSLLLQFIRLPTFLCPDCVLLQHGLSEKSGRVWRFMHPFASICEGAIQDRLVSDSGIYFVWYLSSSELNVDIFRALRHKINNWIIFFGQVINCQTRLARSVEAAQINLTPKHFCPDLDFRPRREKKTRPVYFWLFTCFHQLLVYFEPLYDRWCQHLWSHASTYWRLVRDRAAHSLIFYHFSNKVPPPDKFTTVLISRDKQPHTPRPTGNLKSPCNL